MTAVVTRGHVRGALESRDLYDALSSVSTLRGVLGVYVNAWDRYETSLSWSRRDATATRRVLTLAVLSRYFHGLPALKNVTVHPTPPSPLPRRNDECRVWMAPCANHRTTFANMASIYETLVASSPSLRRLVSVRNDVFALTKHNPSVPHSLSSHNVQTRLRDHVTRTSDDLAFAVGSCTLVVGVDAILSGAPHNLLRHARHLLTRWGPALTSEYHVHRPHHEYVVVEMARELGLCPPRATFVHITKSGGTTLEQGFATRCPRQVTGRGHGTTERSVATEHTLTVVRDPIDRLHSQFFYWRDGARIPPWIRTSSQREQNRKLFPTLARFLDAAVQNTPEFRRVTTTTQGFTWGQHFAPQSTWLNTPTHAHLVCFHPSELIARTQRLLDLLRIPCNVSGIETKNPTLAYTREPLSPVHVAWVRRTFRSDFELWNAAGCA